MKMLVIHSDCRHYKTDRPCAPHKQTGVVCGDCTVYDPIKTRILIVKLDAIGDVLRTTSLLKPLKEKYPNSEVTWLTKSSSVELLYNNPYVDHVIPKGADALELLLSKHFDVVINPDTSEASTRLATLAKATQKFGYVFSNSGEISPLNATAQAWYVMGLNDRLKKENQKSYQEILLEVCGLPPVDHPIIWNVSNKEREFAERFAAQHSMDFRKHPVIGLNTGAGGRWRWKKWTLEGFSELIRMIIAELPDAKILLYGGPEEIERNAYLRALAPDHVVDTGTDNSLREFGALVSLCDVMVTGDTLGLHVATAQGKGIIALFGPTSAPEIELYGRGEKIVPKNLDCLGCYLSDCDVTPACMERIHSQEVFSHVRTHLAPVVTAKATGSSS
jgi:ADP-heptose:LPS heptosyltransferase